MSNITENRQEMETTTFQSKAYAEASLDATSDSRAEKEKKIPSRSKAKPTKAKEVLGEKLAIGVIQDISFSRLHDPPCEDRFSLDLEIGIEGYKDAQLKEFLRKCVLKAVYYPEADKLFVVEGKCFLHKARELKLKKLRCLVAV